MDDFIGRRGLLEAARLKSLSRRSDAKGLVRLAGHGAAIAATTAGLAYSWGTAWCVPVFVLHGMLLNYLYAAQHECSHWTAFESRRLNDAVGRATGFLLFFARDDDRWLHFTHHRHTQDLARDPEIAGRKPFTLGSYLASLSGLAYWPTRFRILLRHAAGRAPEPYLSDDQRRAVIAEARWHFAGYAAIAAAAAAFQSWIPVMYWVAPLLLTKWTHQTQNLIEHTGLSHAPDTLANTRTITTTAFLRWLVWNMTYHSVHHTFPGVPFHALPELHRAVVDKIGHEPPSSGYLAFNWRMIRALAAGRSPAGAFG